MELTAEDRRDLILQELINASGPRTASSLAKSYNVSRQIVVGDIAILRASGYDILATPRGYIFESSDISPLPVVELLPCHHTKEQMRDELYTIVDNGATAIDVSVEHPIYGEIVANLNLSSRFDVDMFINKFSQFENASPISALTGGTHLHRIGAKDIETIDRIRNLLKEKGMLTI